MNHNGHLLFPRYFIHKLHIFCRKINGNIDSIPLYYLTTDLHSAALIIPSEVERQWTQIIIVIIAAYCIRKLKRRISRENGPNRLLFDMNYFSMYCRVERSVPNPLLPLPMHETH